MATASEHRTALQLAARAAHVKVVYEGLIGPLREAARYHGYALAVHGSLARDIDLIAVPWEKGADDPGDLVLALLAVCRSVYGKAYIPKSEPAEKSHGRIAWEIHLWGEAFTYIDLSVMPRREDVG